MEGKEPSRPPPAWEDGERQEPLSAAPGTGDGGVERVSVELCLRCRGLELQENKKQSKWRVLY